MHLALYIELEQIWFGEFANTLGNIREPFQLQIGQIVFLTDFKEAELNQLPCYSLNLRL